MSKHNQFTPRFTPLSSQSGLRVDDPVEEVQFRLATPEPVTVSPVAVEDHEWAFPLDSAARVSTNELHVPIRVATYVRRPDGSLVAAADTDKEVVVSASGPYTVEVASTPIKLYVGATSRVRVTAENHRTRIVFPNVDSITIGARSLHKRPARTITTTTAPKDVMAAVSEFGAALKSTTPERSFPTLHGHPPLLEFGDELSIPGGRRRPDTGLRLELPPELSYIFPSVSLAYYLGAAVVPGDEPRLVSTAGATYRFDTPGFATDVTKLLRHVFTLDCLTRVEGYYPVELDERRQASALGLDLPWAELYDQPLAERTAAYLDVPFDRVEPLIPEWRLTADIVPDMDHATVLPHLANELATVRLYTDESGADAVSAADEVTAAIDEFVRTTPGHESFTRSCAARSSDTDADKRSVSREDVLRVPPSDTATQTYIGEGFPLNANKGSQLSYERQLELRGDAPGRIDVTVVCNDDEMLGELDVGDHYGTRDLFDFDVTIRSALSREELATVLEADSDLLHYIGHVDQRGLQATDSYLDADEIDRVGATAFILNGCRSFRQGQRLIDAGAIAGIVTLENVHNSLATTVGTNVARLLNRGWPLDAAVELVRDDALVGRHYIVVGDGSVEIAKSDSGNPTVTTIAPNEWDDRFSVTIRAYATRARHLGSIYHPYIGENQLQYLASGELDTFDVSQDELAEYLSLETEPVQLEEEQADTTVSLRWSDEIDVNQL